MYYSTLLALFVLMATVAPAKRFCRPGTFRDGGMCKPCPKGEFQNKPNRASCKFCKDGTTTERLGAISRKECTPCDRPNEVVDVSFGGCKCKIFTARDPKGRCAPCPPGTLPFLFFEPEGCETCDKTRCIKCEKDEILVKDDKCGKCPPGKEPFEKFRGCIPCLPGTFKAGFGQRMCRKCRKNTFSGRKASRCIRCPPGKALMKNGKCRSCKAGQFFFAEFRKCRPCFPRTFRPRRGAFLRCRRCPKDKFSGFGATKCITCPPGTVLLRSGKCGNCPPGTEYIRSSLVCAPR